MMIKRRGTVDRVDNRDHTVQHEVLRNDRIAHDRLHDGCRIGKPGGLDHYPLYRLQTSGLDAIHQLGQRIHQFAAHRAA